ncbi:M16 family metallopeptidase [Isoalcanivorax indicus]|uniref:M16 family metallopeptidase n=1 Tax=Isoalcanivorax indicus TaxID=2202653 RepID=UPI001FE8FB6C|nr:pitrilysin family protein [Isoalcanivorax indicus]
MSDSRYVAALIAVPVLIVLVMVVASRTHDRDTSAAPVSFPVSLAEVEAAQPGRRELAIQHWQTDAGSRVLHVQTDQLPMVDVRLVFNAGSARDGDLAGLASLTNALLDQGADGMGVDEIASGFEDLGARFGSSSHRDMALVTLTSLNDAEFLEPALALTARILRAPDFPEDALNRVRTRMQQGLLMQQQVPGPQVSRAFQETLFGAHPYGIPSSGTLESLPRLRRDDLQRFYRDFYTAGNAVIAVVGALSEAEARALANRLSSALPEGGRAPALPQAEPPAESTRRHITFNSSQTHIQIGTQVISRDHEDYVPLYVGNHVFGGGGFSAVLMDEVRQRRGLVYGISSSITPMAAAAPFQIALQTGNDNADEALGLTLSLLEQFVEEGPTDEQVQRAIDYLTGSFAMSTASNSAIVGQLGSIGFYDLPLDYMDQFQRDIAAVTAEQIRTALRRHLDPTRLAIASIGPRAPEARLPDDDPDGAE